MINLYQISSRLHTELWDLESKSSIVTTPLLPNLNYLFGGSFLLSANECRQSGELLKFELNRTFNLKQSKSNLILMILYVNYFIYGLKKAKSTQMNKNAYYFYHICKYWRHFFAELTRILSP